MFIWEIDHIGCDYCYISLDVCFLYAREVDDRCVVYASLVEWVMDVGLDYESCLLGGNYMLLVFCWVFIGNLY